MEEQLISFETAILAKDKGFDWIKWDYKWYNNIGDLKLSFQSCDEPIDCNRVSAPTQSLLQKWLREVHNIIVWYEPFTVGTSCTFMWNIGLLENIWHLAHFSMRKHTTPEEALEVGLLEALKLIK